ncbi:Rhodanese-related sulfurtransferase [Shimia gijangensis]|uniref:Rhodanese-related sulfurtransferase n=1 Tax=Shimia gijangensis TaxID=1470563 RepID=A0A1M6B2L5_9RHOB|nr:rhodanese-like domain-containing protein [Shimia gijangensis]SHI42984.1 Rhodanese-related sulfurtransferase [Shimia gijangensis]
MPITPVKSLVEHAKTEIETLSQEDVQEQAAAGTAQLVDIRDIRELKREGRIAGAMHAPRGMLEFWVDPASPYHRADFITDKKLVLFCAGALRSALAVKALQDMGVENIAEMEGGFGAWKSRGAPIETD